MAKVGLELFTAAGPVALTALRDLGFRVFADLKLHDIPTTVERTASVLGVLGASYVTMHASGGEPMLRAGVEGLARGAAAAGSEPPVALAVTVLTSEADAGGHVFAHRVADAVEAGCGGLVCAAAEVAQAKTLAPRLLAVVARHPARRRPHARPGSAGDTGRRDRRGRRPPGDREGGDQGRRPGGGRRRGDRGGGRGARCPRSLGHPALG